MQSSKPVQAGIIVAGNYTKNTVCWPIIVQFRQTRCVITCQVLNINTVLVKYLRITMQIQRTHRGVLPYVGFNTLTLGARGFFHARFIRFRHPRKPRGMSQSRWWKRRDERIWKLSSRLFSWPDWLPLGLWSPTPRMPFRLSQVKDVSACGRRSSPSHARKEDLWYPRPGYNTPHICWNISHFTPTPTLIQVSPICKPHTRISTLGKERTSKLKEKKNKLVEKAKSSV